MEQEQIIFTEKRVLALESELAALRQEHRLISKISNTINLDKLLDLLALEIDAVGHFDGYMVNLADSKRENLVCEKIKLPPEFSSMEKTYQKYRFPLNLLDANVEAYGQRHRVRIQKENVSHFEGDTRVRFERWALQSMVVVPILNEEVGEEPLGTLMIASQSGLISNEKVAIVEHLLLLFRRQIRQAFLYQEVKEQQRELQLAVDEQHRFFQFVSKIITLNNSQQIYDTISSEFLRRFPFDLFAILMREGDQLVPKKFKVINDKYHDVSADLESYYYDKAYQLGVSDGASVTCFEQNKSLIIQDAMKLLHLPMSEKDKQGLRCLKTPHTFVFVPVRRVEQAVGLIWLISLGQPINFSEAQLKLVELLGSFIGTALANAELYTLAQNQKEKIEILNFSLKLKVEELNDLAAKDRLTGLNNFGFFEEELKRRADEYRRDDADHDMSLVILDVDFFKKFNDNYGHVSGNGVLQEVARRMNALARKMDIVCRYGGEEFAVLLPKCTLEGARIFAERVRQDIESTPFDAEGIKVTVTASLGCAMFDRKEDVDSFVNRADKALYRAKNNGRNRVEVFDNEVPNSDLPDSL